MTRKEEIEARKVEIREEVEAAEDIEKVEELEKEVDALNEEETQIEDQEKTEKVAEEMEEKKSAVKEIEREERKMENKKEYRDIYLSNLMGKELNDEERSILVAENGAIPTETQNTIFEKVVKKAPMLDEITLLNVKGNVSFYVEGTRTDGADHAEGADITESDVPLIRVDLAGTEIVKLATISDTVKTMSIQAFEAWLTDMLADSIANAIEAKIFNKIEADGTAVTGSIDAAGIRSLVAGLPAGYEAGAKFYANKNLFYNSILGLQDLSKNELVTREGGKYFILGYEVVISDKATKVTFGNAKKFVGNLAEDINIHSQYNIGNNTYSYSGVAIYDGKVADATAFQVLTPGV